MLAGGQDAVPERLGVDQDLRDGADPRARHVRLGEAGLPLRGRMRGQALADGPDQLRLVRVAPDHGLEPGIVEPRVEAERPAEPRPELRQLHVEVEVAVPRGVDPRHPVAEEIPDGLRRLDGLGPEGPPGLHREHAVEERGLDPLARAGLAAGDQGEQDAGDREAPRVVVDEAPAHELRRALVRPRPAPTRGRRRTARPGRGRAARRAGRSGRTRTRSSRRAARSRRGASARRARGGPRRPAGSSRRTRPRSARAVARWRGRPGASGRRPRSACRG